MAVDMNRSTNTVPVSLSTSYLTGSPCIGISITTLQSFGTSLPAGTRSKLIAGLSRNGVRQKKSRYHRCAAHLQRGPIPMRSLFLMLAALALMAVADVHAQDRTEAAPLVAPFSAAKPGGPMPRGWQPYSLGAGKRPTEYTLVDDQGRTVLHANAEAAASALTFAVKFDINLAPIVEWRWKVAGLIEGADNS